MDHLAFGPRRALSTKHGEDATPLSIAPWRDAFEAEHAFDAHAWAYESPVRLQAKESAGALCRFLFLDVDQPTPAAILEAFPDDHFLSRWAAVYPTRGGIRLVYHFEQPVFAHEYGPIARGVCLDLFRVTKLQADPTTDEWHRCFRLPKVTRADDKAQGPTWLEPYFWPALISEATVDPDELPKWADRLPWDDRSSRGPKLPAGEMPAGLGLMGSRASTYRRALKGSRFFAYIFEGETIPQGRRDQTVVAIVAEVVGKVFLGVAESSAEEVYQLLQGVVEMMAPDGSESWTEKLWRVTQYVWNEEVKKQEEKQKKHAADLTTRDGIIAQMLKALPASLVPTDPNEYRAFLERHFCLQTATGAYVIQKDGNYSRVPLRPSQLPAHFNDGLHCLVDGGFRTSKGAMLPGNSILNHFSTNLDDVVFETGAEPTVRLEVENDRRILHIVPFALRQDLLEQAEFDQECGEWLTKFTDERLIKRWIAAALALHKGPVAALYLNGPARVGKSMLSKALAECFACQPVPGSHAFGQFNGALLQSPVIMIDEGLPSFMSGMDPADTFRSLVTGSAVSTQKKYQDQVNSNIPYRIIFGANSYDMVRKLIGKRTMDPQDREALRERTLVVETGRAPADWLDARGATKFTHDWIAGKARLVKHMLKLYLTQVVESEFQADGRLLVEGRPHPAFTLQFDLSGSGRDIVDKLTDDITKAAAGKGVNLDLKKAIVIETGQVWLKKRPYIRYACGNAPVRAEAFSTALDRFLTGQSRISGSDMSQMVRVDIEKLMFCAQSEGLDTTHLQALRLQASGVA